MLHLWHGPLPCLSVPEDEVIWLQSQAGIVSGNLASWLSFAACCELGAVQVLLMLLCGCRSSGEHGREGCRMSGQVVVGL